MWRDVLVGIVLVVIATFTVYAAADIVKNIRNDWRD